MAPPDTSVIEPAQHMNHHYHQQHGLAGGAGGSAVHPNVGFSGIGTMPTSALPPQVGMMPTQHAIHYNSNLLYSSSRVPIQSVQPDTLKHMRRAKVAHTLPPSPSV